MPWAIQVMKNSAISERPRPNSRQTLRRDDDSTWMLRAIEKIRNASDPRARTVASTIIHAPSLMSRAPFTQLVPFFPPDHPTMPNRDESPRTGAARLVTPWVGIGDRRKPQLGGGRMSTTRQKEAARRNLKKARAAQ